MLFIMAAMMAVLIAAVGCAVDGSRMYMVQTRLQLACDAGVLAGRRTLTVGNPLDTSATGPAQTFFANNYRPGWFGTTGVTFTPTLTATSQVKGVANATVPMTIMKLFMVPDRAVTANCGAQFDLPDTDIVFVLDTTGSMACQPTESDSCGGGGTFTYVRPADGAASGNDSVAGYPGSTAYHEIENGGSRISAVRTAVQNFYATLASAMASSPATKLRYGFVTYSSTVNAGKALLEVSPGYLVGGAGNGNASWTYQSRYATGGKWQYQPVSWNVQNYVNNASVTNTTTSPNTTSSWAGCVEAPDTTGGITVFDQNNLPNDLNPDAIPDGNISNQWKPMWQDAEYARNNWNNTSNVWTTNDYYNYNVNGGGNSLADNGYVSCGKPISRLKVMSATDVANYVNASDFTPMGGTYHDTGMIWGVRLIAPNGMFAADTTAWPGRNAPNRVIVFLTDGNMAPNYGIYGMYGMEFFDGRVSGTPGITDNNALSNLHNARMLAECTAAKTRGITIFTVTIGPNPNANLTNCASTPSQALVTQSGAGINSAFQTIAQQVAKLRLSQ